jgi:hypothetical protein
VGLLQPGCNNDAERVRWGSSKEGTTTRHCDLIQVCHAASWSIPHPYLLSPPCPIRTPQDGRLAGGRSCDWLTKSTVPAHWTRLRVRIKEGVLRA